MIDRLRSAGRNDEGTVTIFVIGSLTFVLALVFVVASASAVHLEQKQLSGAADALAVSAANAEVSDGFFETGGTGEGPRQLTQAEVERGVQEHLAAYPQFFDGLNVTQVDVTVSGGDTAVVRLQARVVPPFTGWVLDRWSGGITITAEGRARTW